MEQISGTRGHPEKGLLPDVLAKTMEVDLLCPNMYWSLTSQANLYSDGRQFGGQSGITCW